MGYEIQEKQPTPGKPLVKLIANMHGDEPVGREVLLHFIDFVCKQYKIDDDIKDIVDNYDVHIMPTMNPDGFFFFWFFLFIFDFF